MGGSTNVVLHSVEIARAAGIDLWGEVLSQDDFNELSRRLPVLVNMRPFGEYSMVDVDAKGGLQVIVKELLEAGFLDGDALTCTGETLAEQVARLDPPAPDQDVIYPVAKPFKDTGGLRLLRGNLAPDGGAILKVAGVEGGMKDGVFTGRARVFNGERSLIEALDRRPETLRGQRHGGDPLRGAARRAGHARAARPHLADHGAVPRAAHHDRADDRRPLLGRDRSASSSATSRPRRFLGGPIALVEDGDTIVVDLNDRPHRLHGSSTTPACWSGAPRRGGPRPRATAASTPTRAGDGPGAGADARHRAARPPRRRHGDAVAELSARNEALGLRLDDPVVEGEDDGGGPVTQAELGEDVPDVALHGHLGDVAARRRPRHWRGHGR